MTKKIGLIFPGQGSQYVGMGSSLEDQSLYDKANEVLNFDLKKLCFEGPEDQLKLTKYTQPAIITHSASLLNQVNKLLKEKNKKVDFVLGHSVGEYGALLAADVLSFEEAIIAVHKRGQFMQEAVQVGIGKMIAILKVPGEIVQKACLEVSNNDCGAYAANFNDPTQTVISGHNEACDKVVQWLKDNFEERFRAVDLPVSAPFHSPLIAKAAEQLKSFLDKLNFMPGQIPYIANIDACLYPAQTASEKIKENLYKQVCGSVLWTQSIANLEDDTLLIEVGPKNVLNAMIRKINPSIKTLSIDKEGVFSELEELLK